MKNKLGQKPAFPIYTDDMPLEGSPGISKRFYAACAAMQGLLANPDIDRFGRHKGDSFDVIAKSYDFADKLLEQENL